MKKKNEQSAVGKTGSRRKTALVLFTAAFMVTAMAALVVSFAPADNDGAGDLALGARPWSFEDPGVDAFGLPWVDTTASKTILGGGNPASGGTHELYGDIRELVEMDGPTLTTSTLIEIVREIWGPAAIVDDDYVIYIIPGDGYTESDPFVIVADITDQFSSPPELHIEFDGVGAIEIYGDGLSLTSVTLLDGSELLIDGKTYKADGDVVLWEFEYEESGDGVSYSSVSGPGTLVMSYTVTYELNGGINNVANSETYTDGDGIVVLKDPTKAGYNFLGWFSDIACTLGNEVEFLDEPGENVTVFAKWSSAITYNIEYRNTMGATNPNTATTFTVATSFTLEDLDDFPVGYIFNKWIDLVTDDDVTSVSEPKDIILWAVWDLDEFEVKYNLNSGTMTGDNPDYVTIEDAFVLEIPIRTGYTFEGWFESNDFSTPRVFALVFIEEDIELWAKWTPTVYTITYDLDGGDNNAANPATYTILSGLITFQNPTKFGHTFEGWFSDAAFTPGNEVTGIAASSTGPVEVFACFELEEYTVTFNMNTTAPFLSTPLTIAPIEYTIMDQEIPFSFIVPTRDGYTFEGWFTDPGTWANQVDGIDVGDARNLTLTAKWEAVEFKIFYDLNKMGPFSPENAATNPLTFTVETIDFLFADASLLGYKFTGWVINETPFDEEVEGIEQGTLLEDLYLLATWELEVYDITYELNDNLAYPAANNAANPDDYSVTDNFPIAFLDPTRLGYDFVGWFSDVGLTLPVKYILIGETDEITIYAKWSLATYDVILNDALGGTPNGTYNTIDGLTLPTGPTANGYVFLGWSDNANLIWNAGAFGQYGQDDVFVPAVWITEIEGDEGVVGDQTFWAYWAAKNVEITFEIEGFDGVASFLYLITPAKGVGYVGPGIVGEWASVNSDETIDAPYGASVTIASVSEGRYTFGWTGVSTGDTTPVAIPFAATGISIMFDLNGQGLNDVGVVVAGEYEFIFGYSYAWAIVILAVISVMVVFVAMSIFGRK